ncbi:hypothetical protein H1Q58_08720 [Planococcus maritimus]|uniref:Uncharacterized protein n=1 Tax=Planococcus maritimus TaxID=192421 RepID=A0A7D7MAE2_PLAMR|nr:hypothetical protein [Planococcus maritimus]QMT16069.1 hypothetical protein H1Q58_08720 [Planococcus maritimus]
MNRQSNQLKQLKRMFDESCRKTNGAIVSELRKQGVNASLCKKPEILEASV